MTISKLRGITKHKPHIYLTTLYHSNKTVWTVDAGANTRLNQYAYWNVQIWNSRREIIRILENEQY